MYVYEITTRGKVTAVLLSLTVLLVVTSIFYAVLGRSGTDDPATSPDVKMNAVTPSGSPPVMPNETETGEQPSDSPAPDEIILTPIPVPTVDVSPTPTKMPVAASINWSKRTASVELDPKNSVINDIEAAKEKLGMLLCDTVPYEAPNLDGWLLVAEANRYEGETDDIYALQRAKTVTWLLTESFGIPQEYVLPISSDKTGSSAAVSLYFIKSGSGSASK